MRDPFFQRLSKVVTDRGPLCVGLDPSRDVVAQWGLDDTAEGIERVARTTLEAVSDVAGIVKAQVAFYERHGSKGFAALGRVLRDASDRGLLAICDAKRGDIDSTNVGYAEAWLSDDSELAGDAVTVTCYLGVASMMPVFELAHETGRGVFVVDASSNPEGRALQTATVVDGVHAGLSVESALLAEVASVNQALDPTGEPSRCVGAVVGPTRRPPGLQDFEGPILVPGIGAQGSGTDEARAMRAFLCHEALAINVSRHILAAGPERTAIEDAATRFADALR
jgi:orotidine-5'-phosphate decarboxylase